MAKGDIRGSGRSNLSGSTGYDAPITLSASPVAGDIILTFLHCVADGRTPSYSGHTQIDVCNTDSYPQIWVFGKVATGSEGTTLNPGFTTQYEGRSAVAYVIEGSYSNLTDVAVYLATRAVTTTTITIPSASQSVSQNSIAFAAAATEADESPTGWSNSFANALGDAATDGDASGMQVTYKTVTSGTSGIQTVATYTNSRIIGGVLVTVGAGASGGSGIVSIKGNLGPRVALGSARVGF